MSETSIKIVDRLNDLLQLHKHPIAPEKMEPMELATLYVAYRKELEWLDQISPFMTDSEICASAKRNLEDYIERITKAYIDIIQSPFIGETDPDILIVLGTVSPHIEARLNLTLELAKQFPHLPIILSGGGRQIALEAEAMEDYLKNKGLTSDRLYQEVDSLDTRGNAVFSKFLMREKGLMDCRNILLITSDFHAPRALRYFQCVYGKNFNISVALSKTDCQIEEMTKLVQGEMGGLVQSNDETFTLHRSSQDGEPLCQNLEGDETSIFYQMLTHDPLYRMHWDLARRYAHFASITPL